MIFISFCKIGSIIKLMVMFDLLIINNWFNDFLDYVLMIVLNRRENGVSILLVYYNSFFRLEG